MDNNGSGGSGKSSSTNVYLEYIKSMKTAIFFVAALAMLFLAIAPIRATQAATFKGDCDGNAIIRCGSETAAGIASKYNALDGKGKAAFIHK